MLSLTRAQFLRGDWQTRSVSPSRVAVACIGPGCLAVQGVFCRTCGEACEPDAIRFTPAVGRAPVPGIVEDACTGCGECIGTCPANAIDLIQHRKKETP